MFQYLLYFAAVAASQYPLECIYQFPSTQRVGIENIAVRSNGNILLTAGSGPVVYELNPASPDPYTLATIPLAQATFGIAETSPDVFTVIAGNVTGPRTGPSGVRDSFALWTVNADQGSIRLLTTLPDAHLLNGATAVLGTKTMLIADSGFGAVWAVNTDSGAYKIFMQDPLFTGTATQALGINGVHVRGDFLYFTNYATGVYGKVPVELQNGDVVALGAARVVAVASDTDDFAIDARGTAWIASHPNSVIAITESGAVSVVAGGENSSALVVPTATAFSGDGCLLYVVTGGQPLPSTEQGQVLTLDTCADWQV